VTPYALNSSFYEQDQLRDQQQAMLLLMHPDDAATRGLTDGAAVQAVNQYGQVNFTLRVTERVPPGTVVTEGVWWQEFLNGKRGVNALTSQRLTDQGAGSTLYDVGVEVKPVR
jgi:anaerobic selenocysteine-containing dehydrogenase